MKQPHWFHIPVMGTGFTIDTPLKVARFGITSVVSLVDDTLIEQMRRWHATRAGEPYEEIPRQAEDSRAKRITAYLNLLDRLVRAQVRTLQNGSFEEGSELSLYYEMLPEGPRRSVYRQMREATDPAIRADLQARLRQWATPGRIDANIMTKLDRDTYCQGQKLAAEYSEALAALRGFAQSDLESAIVFSAGMNARLYTYAAQFADFLPDAGGRLRKKIILKVSDFRSAAIQSKFLAKRGLWVSEYRVESGLNCGGHAFATDGALLGPILAEFRAHRRELADELFAACQKALASRGKPSFAAPPHPDVTVQGGIGTSQEQELLFKQYQVDGTGWGTPFLLVPEATNVDPSHLARLEAAGEGDVELSDHSPLGVPFWILKDSDSERARRSRAAEGRPGSACPKGHLASNTEFTEAPLCTASRTYQHRKLDSINDAALAPEERLQAREKVLSKTCICHDLAGGATLTHGIDPAATTAVCCGPNIVNFNKIATLRDLIDHIYGRSSLLANDHRPHMFVRELMLNIDHLRDAWRNAAEGSSARAVEALETFRQNLFEGIAHYRAMADQITEGKARFLDDLEQLARLLSEIHVGLQPA
jgi:hypothetical protein